MKGEQVHQALVGVSHPDLYQAIDTEWPPVLEPGSLLTAILIANADVHLRSFSIILRTHQPCVADGLYRLYLVGSERFLHTV